MFPLPISLVALTAQPVVVDISGTSLADQFAVYTCAGLYNRLGASPDGAYVLSDADSKSWLADIAGVTSPTLTSPADFIGSCVALSGPASGYILWNTSLLKAVIPNIVTMAAVLDAVPLVTTPPVLPTLALAVAPHSEPPYHPTGTWERAYLAGHAACIRCRFDLRGVHAVEGHRVGVRQVCQPHNDDGENGPGVQPNGRADSSAAPE